MLNILIKQFNLFAGQSIEKVEDLDNKIWAISRMGSGSHLMAVLLAEQQGWNKENLRFEIVNNLEGAREALREKPEAPARANGFLWEKFMTKPLVDQGEFRRVGEIPTPWPCFVVAVRRPFLAQHSEAVRDLLDALRPVTAEFKAGGDASAALVAQTFGQRAEDARTWLDTVQWTVDTARPDAMLDMVSSTLHRLGLVDKPAAAAALWHQL
mmetsp:Transcript_32160/g.85783  ORF Transcript_32160/g.85783 Transcript_32160/m.85783 type:complete len:211 (-) Transcript_32160:113-745(-)